jgi:hypothetical protein
MMAAKLTKIEAKTAAELAGQLELSEAAGAMLRDGIAPAEYLDLLMAGGQWADAIRLLALALPKREAVWWACGCARKASPAPSPAAEAALAAAEAWVAEPTEERRRVAFPAAEKAQFGTPAGCAALAVFLSGGSLAPPEIAAVPPAEDLTGKTVAGAVLLAGVITEPEKASEKYRAFLADGLAIAEGKQG